MGRGGRENEKFPHLCPVPSDQDHVASVAVFIVSTGGLVFIGYGAGKVGGGRWVTLPSVFVFAILHTFVVPSNYTISRIRDPIFILFSTLCSL